MTKQITVKVTKNQFGNFRGFVTGKQPVHLGDFAFNACEWARAQLAANPGAKFNAEKSAVEVRA